MVQLTTGRARAGGREGRGKGRGRERSQRVIWTMDWSNRRYRRIVDEFRPDRFRLPSRGAAAANYKRQKQRRLLSIFQVDPFGAFIEFCAILEFLRLHRRDFFQFQDIMRDGAVENR